MVSALVVVLLSAVSLAYLYWLHRTGRPPEWLPVPVPDLDDFPVPDATFDHRGLV